MRIGGRYPRLALAHAIRVAAVSTLVIGSAYVMVSVIFDAVDAHRLVAQVDAHLHDRLFDLSHRHSALPAGGCFSTSPVRFLLSQLNIDPS